MNLFIEWTWVSDELFYPHFFVSVTALDEIPSRVSQVPANLAQDLLRGKETLDPSPQHVSDNDFMALTIIEESLNVFEVPSNLCSIITINSDFTFIVGLRQQ